MKKKKKYIKKKIILLGKAYTLKYVSNLGEYDGHCDPPDAVNKFIYIKSGMEEKRELETLLHEFLHALDWSKDETWVEQSAEDISKILWRLGWRKAGS
jgi:Zn-dependent peptidase ImmA (M78 family)